MRPKISVVVPAYNAEETIEDTIQGLLNQDYPKKDYEIIVVDDGSNDNTKEIIKKFKRVKLFEQKHKGPAAARNLGVKYSKGNIVLFTDADCVPVKNWIRNMVKPFEDKSIAGVAGTYKTLNKEKLVARFVGYEIADRHRKMKNIKTIDFVGTYSAGYRKNIFLKFGGFDTSFRTSSGEDPELSFRIVKKGYKIVFNPKTFVYHRHPDTILKLLKQKSSRGFWRIHLYKKHKEKMFKHSYTPQSVYIEMAGLGISIIFFILNIIGLIPLLYGFVTLFLTFLLPSRLSFRIYKKDKKIAIISPFLILLENLAIGLGVLCGLIYFSGFNKFHKLRVI